MPRFTNPALPLSDTDLLDAEAKMGVSLPADLLQHYKSVNGGRPLLNSLVLRDRVYEVHQFFAIKHAGRMETLEDAYVFCQENPDLPKQSIPFACDAGGDWFCYSLAPQTRGRVFYFRSDDFAEPEVAVHWLANSLSEFLHGLTEPSDPLVAYAGEA
jgi:cell wall assembly regulator SMI1